MTDKLFKTEFTQNRELSWLKFNDRVLSEAMDETVPLFERLKFVSIFTSNLDEFFMIRVGSLFDLMNANENSIDNKSGMTPKMQLDAIYDEVRTLYRKREDVFHEIENQLRVHDIYQLEYSELEKMEKKFVNDYFTNSIEPILSPQIIDTHHPFPHLANKIIHIGAILKHNGKEVFGVIPVPTALPDLIFLPGNELRYIRTENIISEFIKKIFAPYEVIEKTVLCVTRNADISPDDEGFEFGDDYRNAMKKVIGQRKRLAPVRLELSNRIKDKFMNYLCEKLTLKPHQVYVTKVPLKMSYVFSLPSKLNNTKKKSLTYKSFTPKIPNSVNMQESIIKQINKHDILLSYPFESMKPFINLIKEAANDPAVISIKITIYRLASQAKLVEYLCAAAENGKDVTALIELRARFDEQNNIDWSKRLEEAGCNIIYGFENYKVHSKICLITRKEHNEIKYITQVGTGNYNEKTAEMYTDVSLMTANKNIAKDATEFFKNMSIGNLEGTYHHLLVAPVSLKSTVIQLIDDEITKGIDGKIFIKINSLTDIDIIEKLKQASCAGVKIKMIIRGICCIVSGIEGKTENIWISNIVGRFLEHSRIYCFGSGQNQKMYISSADFMTRNTERRVEVGCPVYDERIKEKLRKILEACEYDNVKARVLQSNGNYIKKEIKNESINAQQMLINLASQNSATVNTTQKQSFWNKLKNFFKK